MSNSIIADGQIEMDFPTVILEPCNSDIIQEIFRNPRIKLQFLNLWITDVLLDLGPGVGKILLKKLRVKSLVGEAEPIIQNEHIVYWDALPEPTAIIEEEEKTK